MEAKFKPRFLKDVQRIRKDTEALSALARIIAQVKAATDLTEVANSKKLAR